MKKLLAISAVVGLLYGCGNSNDTPLTENVVVANRGSGNLSVIDATTDTVKQTVTLPAGAQPMYVVHVPSTKRIYVGDRGNNQVYALNAATFAVEDTIPVGNGVFHMWADAQGQSLWVANDVDNTISVIKLSDNTVRTLALTDKPHDVFLTADGKTAYVSFIVPNVADKVRSYDAQTLAPVASADVGEDPHLYFVEQEQKLYVANQSGSLIVLNRDLTAPTTLALPGAHGIYAARSGKQVFVTNIAGQQLYTVDTVTKMLAQPAVAASEITPHNLVVNSDDKKLFVTHSGAKADKVTVYGIGANGALTAGKTVTAGTNPFGITYYRY